MGPRSTVHPSWSCASAAVLRALDDVVLEGLGDEAELLAEPRDADDDVAAPFGVLLGLSQALGAYHVELKLPHAGRDRGLQRLDEVPATLTPEEARGQLDNGRAAAGGLVVGEAGQ